MILALGAIAAAVLGIGAACSSDDDDCDEDNDNGYEARCARLRAASEARHRKAEAKKRERKRLEEARIAEARSELPNVVQSVVRSFLTTQGAMSEDVREDCSSWEFKAFAKDVASLREQVGRIVESKLAQRQADLAAKESQLKELALCVKELEATVGCDSKTDRS